MLRKYNQFIKKYSEVLISITIFVVTLIIYISTMSPTVNFGDTGELILASKVLGIPHPPGFPTWVILSHFFTYVPLGDIAWRVNLSSAVFTSLTIVVIFLTLKYLLIKLSFSKLSSSIIGVFSSLICAFIVPVWMNGLIAEVYSLVLLFQILIIFSSLKFYYENKNIYLYLTALLFGLGVGVHYLIFMVVPFVGLVVIIRLFKLYKNNGKFPIKNVIYSLLFLLLGLSVFLYLPIRSLANPAIDWGNPENLNNFKKVITREQFRNDIFDTDANLLVEDKEEKNFVHKIFDVLIYTFQNLAKTFTAPLFLIGLFGFYLLYKKDRAMFIAFLVGSFGATLMFAYAIGLNIDHPAMVFGFPSIVYILFVSVFSVSYVYFSDLIKSKLKKSLYTVLFFTPLLVIPTYFMVTNYKKADFSSNNIAYLHAKSILDMVEDDAILFVEENNWLFPITYLNLVEGYKPEVTIYDRNGNLFENIYEGKAVNRGIEDVFEKDRRIQERNLVLDSDRPAYYLVDKKFENYGYDDVYPYGILYKYVPEKVNNLDNDLNGVEESSTPNIYLDQDFSFEETYKELLNVDINNYDNYWDSRYILAYYHMQHADYLTRKGEFELAKQALDKAFEWGREDSHMLNNVATLLVMIGEVEEAKKVLNQALIVRDNKISHYNLGGIYFRGGELDKAELEYIKAIDLDNNYISAIISLALLYGDKGDYEKALYGMNLAKSLDPSNQFVNQKIFEYENLMNEIEQGDADVINPENLNDVENNNEGEDRDRSDDTYNWEVNYRQAFNLAKSGKCDKAITIFEELSSVNPNDIQVLNNLGVCYAQEGQYDEAKSTWEEVLVIDPQNVVANDNLNMIQRVE